MGPRREWPMLKRIPINVPTYDYPGGPPRETTMEDHHRRVRMIEAGTWRVEYQIGRKSERKPSFLCIDFEWTHGVKNLLTEWLRERGWFNRGGRPADKPDGYRWPGPETR